LPPGADAATATGSRVFRVVATAVIVVVMVALAGCSSSSSRPRSEPEPTTTTATTTTVHRAAHVSLFGDSLSVQARAMLRSQGRAHGLKINVAAYFGLAPCDLAKGVRHDVLSSPGAIVLEFSGNNLTPCMKRNGTSLTGAAYYAAYHDDVDALVVAAVAHDIPVLIVGAPSFPDNENVPDRVELNTVLRAVADAHPGARFVATAPDVSPDGFARTLPCLEEETAALGCEDGRITVRGGNGIHFDDPRTVPCPNGHRVCIYTAGGHRFVNAIMRGLAEIDGLSYVDVPPSVGIPADKALDG
jgi:hypothetical protein